ncbi:MAG: flagellar basal body P-ring formation chaperone FlgA [Deltaproteobacteria bacterium]|nr:flagellar basal body P-ring formation chaperone FlgA [Deltaproteobacteria bacterium]
MKANGLLTTLLCLLGLALAAPALAGSSVVNFATRAEVAERQVRLLDLVDQPGSLDEGLQQELAQVKVMDTPKAGQEVNLPGSKVRQLLQSARLAQPVSALIPPQIAVARAEQRLDSETLAAAYRRAVLDRLGAQAEQAQIRDIDTGPSLVLPQGRLTTQVRLLPGRRTGRVPATVEVYVAGRKEALVKVSGTVDLFQEVVVAAEPLERGHRICKGDLEVRRINLALHRLDTAITDPAQAVDLTTRRVVSAGEPLDLRELDKAPVIQRGDVVTMILRRPGLSITAKGKAQDRGFKGGRIALTNLSSKREVWGTVLDSGTVLVDF